MKRPNEIIKNPATGYPQDLFSGIKQKFALVFIPRFHFDINNQKYLKVFFTYISDGLDLEFITTTSTVKDNSNGDQYTLIDRADMSDRQFPGALVFKGTQNSNKAEGFVKEVFLLKKDQWKNFDRFSYVIKIDPLTQTKLLTPKAFILNVECDIIIPPIP
jgi:hypothetical protein